VFRKTADGQPLFHEHSRYTCGGAQ